MTTETIAVIANLALALSFIVGLIFGIVEVRAAGRDRKERLTLETLRNLQTRDFAELIFFINASKTLSNQKEFQSIPAEDQVKYIQFGQEMESLGLLVAERFIDLDLVDKTLGSFVTTTWEKYRAVFQDIRVNTADPFLGEYFQWLAECIEMRMKKNPRKPFFETHRQTPGMAK